MAPTKSSGKKKIKKLFKDKESQPIVDQNIGQESYTSGSEHIYAAHMLDNFNKMIKFYGEVIEMLATSNADLANTGKKLQKECSQHNNAEMINNLNIIKELYSCKTMGDMARVQGELIKDNINNNIFNFLTFSNFVSEFNEKAVNNLRHSMDYLHTKMKESCRISQ